MFNLPKLTYVIKIVQQEFLFSVSYALIRVQEYAFDTINDNNHNIINHNKRKDITFSRIRYFVKSSQKGEKSIKANK